MLANKNYDRIGFAAGAFVMVSSLVSAAWLICLYPKLKLMNGLSERGYQSFLDFYYYTAFCVLPGFGFLIAISMTAFWMAKKRRSVSETGASKTQPTINRGV
jgi:hypothetical protein